jgi:hypothetical protein
MRRTIGRKLQNSDCDRDSDDIIDDGTRGGFRVDDSDFEFKDLSIREIELRQPANQTFLPYSIQTISQNK